MSEPPVHVVGGGPTGLGAALALGQRGLRVVVHEAASGPGIDKACGEGIMPDGVEVLEGWGVEPGGRPFPGIVWRDDRSLATADFPDGPGCGVRRTTLHRRLAEAAAKVAEIRWGDRVLGVDPGEHGESARVETQRGFEDASWVVVADGLRSRIRAQLGLNGRPGKTQRFGVRRHFSLAPEDVPDRVEVWWGEREEAYVTPVGEGEMGIGVLWSGRKAGFDDLLAEFPELVERVAGAATTSRDRGMGPLDQPARGVRRGGALLVGDAAGYLDAITGEGLAMGFRQAEAVADLLVAGRAEHWPAVHRRMMRVPTLLIRLLLVSEAHAGLQRRLLAATAKDPGLFEGLLRVHVGKAPLGPRLVGRLLFGLARA